MAGQGQQQHDAGFFSQQAPDTTDEHQTQRQCNVAAGQQVAPLVTPAPQGPQGKRPQGPAKPEIHADQVAPSHPTAGQRLHAPTPEVKSLRQTGTQQHHEGEDCQNPQAAAAQTLQFLGGAFVFRLRRQPVMGMSKGMHQQARRGNSDGYGRRAGKRQAHHAQAAGHHGARGMVRQGSQSKQQHRYAPQLHQCGRRLVRRFSQSQAGQQSQQPAVGDGSGVIGRPRLPAESKTDRLRRPRTRQVINTEPTPQQGQRQHGHENQPNSLRSCHPGGRNLYGPCPQPIRQQGVEIGGFAQHARLEPGGMTARQFQHVAKAGDVVALPGVAPDKPRQYVNRAKKQQPPARQAAHALLGNNGWRRLIHKKALRLGDAR